MDGVTTTTNSPSVSDHMNSDFQDSAVDGDVIGEGNIAPLESASPDPTLISSDALPRESDSSGPAPHRIIEAILLASDTQLPAAKIAAIAEIGTARDIKRHIAELNREYEERGMSFRIEEIAGGFQILTLPEYNAWLTKLLRVRQETKLSSAAMETLAVVAYKQPCTRADVESIRGVAAGDMLNRLREMNLVKIVGRAEDLGRPILYGTTRRFLEVFGLPSLEELPQVEALRLASGRPASTDTAESWKGAEVSTDGLKSTSPVDDSAGDATTAES